MKSISLVRLTLRNFKGIRDFVLEPDSGSGNVFGDNATGKTTLFDSFVWLLFGKDSQNRADFEIKTLDSQGNPIHNLNHEVEGVLMVDGRHKTLLKSHAEKWTKKRGSATQEFTGHETTYFVDGVPVGKGEYGDLVNSIVNEGVFKLLTNPMYFNEQLKWPERRKILMEVCGDLSDSEIISSNSKLSKLTSILGDRSIENHRKVIAARRAKINEELEKIPVRIDEVFRSMPKLEGNMNAFQLVIDSLSIQIEEKQAELSRLQNGGEISVKENRQRELEGELLQLKNELQAGTMDKIGVKRQEVSRLRSELDTLRDGRVSLSRTIAHVIQSIDVQEAEVTRLRGEWNNINNEPFLLHQEENCPTCGQSLPSDQLQAAHDKALSAFNLSKSDRLEKITTKGKAIAVDIKQMKAENENHTKDFDASAQLVTDKESELHRAESELSALQLDVTDVETNPQYTQKQQEISIVKSEVTNLRSSSLSVIGEVRLSLAQLKTDLELQEKNKASFAQAEASEQRIDTLKQQEKDLASEYEQLEQELYLTEEFIRTKVAMLESKINSKFKYARFKLFDTQINGGVSECCETVFEGVPYSGGLNNGSRINVGLDIINTLSEHYGVTAPIFVDNAESVTQLNEMNTQIIQLIVPPSFDKLPEEVRDRLIFLYGDYEKALIAWGEQNKQLRVETSKQNMKEAV